MSPSGTRWSATGPEDLVYLSSYNNLDIAWENPLYERFLRRLSSFARVIVIDRRGTGCLRPLLARRPSRAGGPRRRSRARCSIRLGRSARCSSASPTRDAVRDVRRDPSRAHLGPDPVRHRRAGKAGARLSVAVVGGGVAGLSRRGQDRMGNPGVRSGISPSFNPISGGRRAHAGLVGAVPAPVGESERPVCAGELMREMDIRPLLPAISVPTLVLHRAEDVVEPVGAGRYLAGEIAGAEYIELAGVDHFPWAGDQNALIKEVERFVGMCGETSRRPTIASSRPSSSPTSSTRPRRRRRWATTGGVTSVRRTIACCGLSWPDSAGGRSRAWATGTSPCSTDRPARCGVLGRSASRWVGWGSSFGPGCTPARSSRTVTTSPGSP